MVGKKQVLPVKGWFFRSIEKSWRNLGCGDLRLDYADVQRISKQTLERGSKLRCVATGDFQKCLTRQRRTLNQEGEKTPLDNAEDQDCR